MAPSATLTTAAIHDRIEDYIVANFLFGDVSKKPADADSLIENGIVDSTGILELIEFIESEFGISVQEDETIPQNLDGLGVLTRFVSSKLAKA